MWESIKAPTGPRRGHCWATPLLLRDRDTYSSAASSVGICQLTAESLPWDAPLQEEICFPKDMPLPQEESGSASIQWLWEKGNRGLAWLPQFQVFLKSHPRFRALPEIHWGPLCASQFSLSLCLILLPSLPDWFPRPLPSQFPECKSLPPSPFPGGLNLWQSRCQRKEYPGHHRTTELSAVMQYVIASCPTCNCMYPLSTWSVPTA